MRAHVGDHITVHSLHVGDRDRHGLIVEVEDPQGAPPYLVRWLDDEHESLVFPGPGAATITAPQPTP